MTSRGRIPAPPALGPTAPTTTSIRKWPLSGIEPGRPLEVHLAEQRGLEEQVVPQHWDRKASGVLPVRVDHVAHVEGAEVGHASTCNLVKHTSSS